MSMPIEVQVSRFQRNRPVNGSDFVLRSATVQYLVARANARLPNGSSMAATCSFFKSLVSASVTPIATKRIMPARKLTVVDRKSIATAEQNRPDEQRIRYCKREKSVDMRMPLNGTEARIIDPRHVASEKHPG